jgi:prevent-host-death family protein
MDITKDIQPMTTFRNHSADIMRHLRETGRPAILTVNGKAAAVVQDAEAYQHLLDLAAEANAAEGIRQGLDDLANGRTRPARGVFDEFRTEYGIGVGSRHV